MNVAIKYILLSVILLNVILMSVIGTILFAFSLFKSWIDATDMFHILKIFFQWQARPSKGLQDLKFHDTKHNDTRHNNKKIWHST